MTLPMRTEPYAEIARRYGIGHLDVHKAMHALANGPTAGELGLSKLELISLIYKVCFLNSFILRDGGCTRSLSHKPPVQGAADGLWFLTWQG